jgi:hypothetical protein
MDSPVQEQYLEALLDHLNTIGQLHDGYLTDGCLRHDSCLGSLARLYVVVCIRRVQQL